MKKIEVVQVNFKKYADSLVPAIIQDMVTNKVLMLGFMSKEAVERTLELKKVTFYSRTKNRLWTKGEESGNYLFLNDIKIDCDNDTILIKATPNGPICHTGADTCFNEVNSNENFLQQLEEIIIERKNNPSSTSYVSSLYANGINKIAQKVGEEAIELVIEAKDNNEVLFKDEAADLLFHYLILLQAKGYSLNDITEVLKKRHSK